MIALDFGRTALCSCAAAAVLSGCGAAQPPIGAPSATPQNRDRYAKRGGSWMLPEAKREALLYLATDSDFAYVIVYPSGSRAGTIKFPAAFGTGICSAPGGDIFVTAETDASPTHGYIYRFKHGGTSPVSTLDDGSITPTGCSVDRTTGNLAVTNEHEGNSPSGNLAVFEHAKGNPVTYSDSDFYRYLDPSYDGNGNLYVLGNGSSWLAELPQGGSALTSIAVNEQVNGTHIQWDGKYLALTEPANNNKSRPIVYRIAVSGSSATVAGETVFGHLRGPHSGDASWIQGHTITMVDRGVTVGFWRYPRGGKSKKVVGTFSWGKPGMTVSLP